MTTTTERRTRRGARLRAGPRTMLLAIIAALAMLVGPAGSVFAPTPAQAQTAQERDRAENTKQMLRCSTALMQHSYNRTDSRTSDVRSTCRTDLDEWVSHLYGDGKVQIWKSEHNRRALLMVALKGTNPKSLDDVKEDLKSQALKPTSYTDFDGLRDEDLENFGRVARGFVDRARVQWNDHVKPMIDQHVLRDEKPVAVLVTGHSLGAAAATILGPVVEQYLADNSPVTRGAAQRRATIVVPFNSPRTHTEAGVGSFNDQLAVEDGFGGDALDLYVIQMERRGDKVRAWPKNMHHPIWDPSAEGCDQPSGAGSGWRAVEGRRWSDASRCLDYKPHFRGVRVGGLNHNSRDTWYSDIEDTFTSSNDIVGLARFEYRWGSNDHRTR